MAVSVTPGLFILLVVISATASQQHCKPKADETGYQTFLRQHYDNPKSPSDDYCKKMMHLKCMTNRDPPMTKCKETNSFTHAEKKDIIAVCGRAGSPYNNGLRVSNKPFSVTTCKIRGDPKIHPCKYRGSTSTRYIAIACEGDLPVHFQEGIIQI